ncbi:MAG: B12-binding domain-containing radical SAM protein [Candidatus Omnitrophica bacterium]|nr:B12-binding domain-containing radical SAM protein [Candidatus Omnitrophota bacterium]
MKILLINPDNPKNSGRDLYLGDIIGSLYTFKNCRKMSFGIPLALPTLAAVTPSYYNVEIIDEMVEDIDFDKDCDFVGITAMTYKAPRAYEIAREFRKRGVKVIMGGIHASVAPDEVSKHVDCVVIGEAEDLWPKILDDFKNNQLKPRYEAKEFPDLSKIPPPRHDLTKYKSYLFYFLQTKRGCPYSCEFCTVTEFNGKSLRVKSPDQVVEEIRELFKLGSFSLSMQDSEDKGKSKNFSPIGIFFTDDNFAINRDYALELCRRLKEFQDKDDVLMGWFTQANYQVGLDDEMLTALRAAGCRLLFIGFESLNQEGLKSMNKTMNLSVNYARCIKNIRKYGMEPVFSVILGNDFDTVSVGEEIAQFIEENKVLYVLPNILTPYPGTALRKRLQSQGRIVLDNPGFYNVRNVVFKPNLMSPIKLQEIYTDLCLRVFSFDKMIKRARECLRYKQRHYIPPLFRVFVLFLFYLTTMRLVFRKKISLSIFLKVIPAAFAPILFNGSIRVLDILSGCVDHDDFARSEARRLPDSPAAQLS